MVDTSWYNSVLSIVPVIFTFCSELTYSLSLPWVSKCVENLIEVVIISWTSLWTLLKVPMYLSSEIFIEMIISNYPPCFLSVGLASSDIRVSTENLGITDHPLAYGMPICIVLRGGFPFMGMWLTYYSINISRLKYSASFIIWTLVIHFPLLFHVRTFLWAFWLLYYLRYVIKDFRSNILYLFLPLTHLTLLWAQISTPI